MAVQPLDQRLDKLNQAVADTEQRAELASTVAEPQTLLPREDLMLADQEQEQPDAVQVAGGRTEFIKGLIKGVTEKAKTVEPRKPAERTLTPEAQQSLELEELQRAGQVTGVGTTQELGIAGRVEQTKVPSMTPEAVTAERQRVLAAGETDLTPPQAAFNLPKMGTDDEIRATIAAIDNLDPAKPKKITFEEVKLKAQESGIGVQFIDDLFSKNLEVNPENTYKALNAVVWANKRVSELADKVATGFATPTEIAEMTQTVHFSHLLQQEVKGYQTNIAQSLAVMRMDRTATTDMAEILSFIGSKDDAQRFAQAYLDLKDNPRAKAEMIRSFAEGNTWEKLFGVYVNGLLSRPGTHVKNFLSSTVFIPYRMVERSGAAGIGGLRRMVGMGSEDRYVAAEVPAMLSSTSTAIRNGFQLAAEAWKTGVPKNWTDPVKIARQQSRMEMLNHRNDGSLMSTAIKGLNYVTTLPGRSLMTADEFFKGINYTHELAAEATRTGVLKFEEAIAAGRTMDEAQTLANDAVDKFVANPPENLMQLSETGTFTQKLEGRLGQLQASMNPDTALSFALRTQIPFISTPVNIMAAVVERTLLGAVSPSLLRDLAKGGTKESDMALTKIGLGTGAVYGFMELTSSGITTGSGPSERGTREAMVRQGWQPYSFVLDVGDNRELFENKFPGMARFGTGEYEGKVFLSYQGLEPVGALMAIGADIYDFLKFEEDDSRINAYVGGAVFGISTYMMEHPFMQGVDNIFQLVRSFTQGSSGDKTQVVAGIDKLAEFMATAARKSVTPLSGSITSVRQQVDPLARDYTPDPSLPVGIKGLMEALGRMRNETPGMSDNLPPKLNLWGEPQDFEYAWAPLRMKAGKQQEVDAHLIQLNVNQAMPGREITAQDPSTGISGKVKLTTEEYNDMLRIANNELRLQDRILALTQSAVNNPSQARVIDMQKVIKGEFDNVFKTARLMLLDRNPELQQRLSEQAARIEEFGQGAR
jgi:hypothetical protein